MQQGAPHDRYKSGEMGPLEFAENKLGNWGYNPSEWSYI